MRNSLDNLAWQLALLTTSKPQTTMTFPIFEHQDRRSRQGFKHRVKQFAAEARKIIQQLQPYHHGESAKIHPLAVLNYLSTMDKHQLLVPTLSVLRAPLKGVPGSYLLRLNNGQAEIQIPLSSKPKVDFEPNLTFQIALQVPAFGIAGLGFARLRNIRKFIADELLPRFAGFFPPS